MKQARLLAEEQAPPSIQIKQLFKPHVRELNGVETRRAGVKICSHNLNTACVSPPREEPHIDEKILWAPKKLNF